MIKISKLALIGALIAVSVASPALAQSFDPEFGTGNVLPLQYGADGGRNNWTVMEPNMQIAVRQGGSTHVAARRSDATRVAAHHKKAVKIAGHRTVRHSA
jgi:hypothetical protein